MPATTDSKGITSGYIAGEDGWGDAMNTNMRVISSAIMNGFSNNASTTTGLTYGYRGGAGLNAGGMFLVSAGTILLPASSTVFVVRDIAGVVSLDLDGTFPDKIHMATVTTNATNIISITDVRYPQDHVQDGRLFARFFTTVTNPAQSGAVRLGNNEAVIARNAANTVDLNLLSLDTSNRVRVAESGSDTIIGGNVSAVGTISTLGGNIQGLRVIGLNEAAANGVETTMLSLKAGDDGVLDSVYYLVTTVPTAVGNDRLVVLQIGDAAALRDYAIKSSQLYVGQNSPAFIGAEVMRVDGVLRASIPFVDITGVPAFDLDGHTHDMSEVTSGDLSVSRIDFDWANLGYTGTNSGARAFNSILPNVGAAGVSYSQAYANDLADAINALNDAVKQLAFDLEARALI